MAAPLQLLLGIVSVATWIQQRFYIESANPRWLMPVVGNLVATLALAFVYSNDTNYAEVGWLWYGFAVVMFIPLFSITLHRVLFKEALGAYPSERV